MKITVRRIKKLERVCFQCGGRMKLCCEQCKPNSTDLNGIAGDRLAEKLQRAVDEKERTVAEEAEGARRRFEEGLNA